LWFRRQIGLKNDIMDVANTTKNIKKDLMNNVSALDGSRPIVLSHVILPGKRSIDSSLCRHLRRFEAEKGKIPVH
jgi:hypothetical protein